MALPDLYRILGVPRSAGQEEIRKAYHAIARVTHPDTEAAKGNPEAGVRFKEATEAYRVLADPNRRRKYDLLHDPAASIYELFAIRPLGQRSLETLFPAPPAAARSGLHAFMAVRIPKEDILRGTSLILELPSELAGPERTVVLTVPPNADKRPYTLIKGCGYPGVNGGDPGDLHVKILAKEESNG